MNDIDVIHWARDIMLQNPDVDADVVYKAARLAEEDNAMFKRFADYAYFDNSYRQKEIYNTIVEDMERTGL